MWELAVKLGANHKTFAKYGEDSESIKISFTLWLDNISIPAFYFLKEIKILFLWKIVTRDKKKVCSLW